MRETFLVTRCVRLRVDINRSDDRVGRRVGHISLAVEPLYEFPATDTLIHRQ